MSLRTSSIHLRDDWNEEVRGSDTSYDLEREFLLVPNQSSQDSTSNNPWAINQLCLVHSRMMLDCSGPLLRAVQSQGLEAGGASVLQILHFFVPCPAKFDLEPLLILLVRSYFLWEKGAFDTDCRFYDS